MATAQSIVPKQQQIRLSLVDWRTYSRLLRAFVDRPGVHLTFDRGERRQLGHNAMAQRFRNWVREKIQKGEGERGA
jgi:hypothetical protein